MNTQPLCLAQGHPDHLHRQLSDQHPGRFCHLLCFWLHVLSAGRCCRWSGRGWWEKPVINTFLGLTRDNEVKLVSQTESTDILEILPRGQVSVTICDGRPGVLRSGAEVWLSCSEGAALDTEAAHWEEQQQPADADPGWFGKQRSKEKSASSKFEERRSRLSR